jgi:hypothetical protein
VEACDDPARAEVTEICLKAHKLLMEINPETCRAQGRGKFLAEDLAASRPLRRHQIDFPAADYPNFDGGRQVVFETFTHGWAIGAR